MNHLLFGNHLFFRGHLTVVSQGFKNPEERDAFVAAFCNLRDQFDIPIEMEVAEEDGAKSVVFKIKPNSLQPGEEDRLIKFLAAVGRAFPGKVYGKYEVWWPMCIDSGPQWLELERDGKLFVQESDIVPGERYEVET